MILIILILAPLFLGGSILASSRLRSRIEKSESPVLFRRRPGWDTAFVIVGGCFVFRASMDAGYLGLLGQACGFLLSAEFFLVAWHNLKVAFGDPGAMVGMRYVAWRSVTSGTWDSDTLEVITAAGKRTRVSIPSHLKDRVEQIASTNILNSS